MKSGDACPRCPFGRLYVANSKPHGASRVQYLRCDICGTPAGKTILPEATIRRRRKRVRS